MMYPLVLDLAADGIPVAVTCRVLGLLQAGVLRVEGQTRSRQRDWDDAHLINAAAGHPPRRPGVRLPVHRRRAARARHHRRREPGAPAVLPAADLVGARQEARPEPQGRAAGARRPGRTASSPPTAPNRLWLTDITEHPTGEGKLYLCAIKDVYSSRIVGYSIDSRMKASAGRRRRCATPSRCAARPAPWCTRDRGSQFRSTRSSAALHATTA